MKRTSSLFATACLMSLTLSLSAGCAETSAPPASPSAPAAASTTPKASSPASEPAAHTSSESSASTETRPAQENAPRVRKTYDKAPPVGNLDEYKKVHAVIETERGNIIFRFFLSEAPRTVASFVKLSRDGFYDGLTFHRVVDDFVIQGGDPEGTGQGGPGYTLKAEFNDHKHVDGAVAMARTEDPNSAGSQFYICLGDIPHLDGKYTVFGQVTKGLDTVHKIRVNDKILRIRIVPDVSAPGEKP